MSVVFSNHDTVTVPDPLPVSGEGIIHPLLLDAVQLPPVHPTGEPITDTATEPAANDGLCDVGLILKEVHVCEDG